MIAELAPGSVDLCTSDPPYGINYYAGSRRVMSIPDVLANDEKPRVEYVPPIVRVVKSGGAIYLCTRIDVMPAWAAALENAGAKLKTPIFWDKCATTKGDLLGDYSNQIEIVLFSHVGRHLLRNGRPNNLWSIPRLAASEHPTVKPVELIKRCIINSSDVGDLVLDPFLGSGTTAVACILTGRRFIGAEINPKYFDMSCKRIERAYRDVDNRLPGFRPMEDEQKLLFN